MPHERGPIAYALIRILNPALADPKTRFCRPLARPRYHQRNLSLSHWP